jgi:low affinity Fe/Cu permease
MSAPKGIQKVALTFTRWVGSPASIFVHTVLFLATIALLIANVFPFNIVILIFNTAVSLEAIYLALFIQMTVNFQAQSIAEVSVDIDEIQEDVGEIQEDIDELQEDVEDISEDVEEMSEEETAEEHRKSEQKQTLATIQNDLRKLMTDIEKLQSKQ